MRKPGNGLFPARKSPSKKRHIGSIEKNNIDKYIRQLVSARTRERPFSFKARTCKKKNACERTETKFPAEPKTQKRFCDKEN